MSFDSGFFQSLCRSPGPTGHEAPVQRVLRRRIAPVAVVETDPIGNLWAAVGPVDGPHLVVSAHADQIGCTVTYIDEHGFVGFATIGGVDHTLLPGRALIIHTSQGPVDGVVGLRPIHLTPKEERGKAPELHEQYLDIGAADREAALARVAIGDPITFAPRFSELSEGILATPGADNRAGVYAAFRALELYAASPGHTRYTALSTVHEETTLLGAKTHALRVRPDCVVVVDVDFASDYPGAEPRKMGGEVKLGRGPVLARGTGSNPRLFDLANEVASAEGIAVQIKAAPGSMSTDADELIAAGGAALSLSLPLRYMHSPNEVVCAADLEAAARLLAALAVRLGEVFVPGYFAV